jgi:signal transduction histidine kinase
MDVPAASPGPSRALLAALALGGLTVGVIAEWLSVNGLFGYSAVDVVRDVAVGWAYLGAGLIAWRRRPASRVGPLMVVVGYTWFIGNFGSIIGLPGVDGRAAPLAALAFSASGIQRAFQTHLIVSYPSGRTSDRIERLFVVAAYLLIFGNALVMLAAVGPSTAESCPPVCPENPFQVITDPGLAETVLFAGGLGEFAVTVGLLAILVRRWLRASATLRRTLAPVWFAATVTVLVFIGSELAERAGTDPETAANVIQAMQIAVPIAFLVGLLRGRLARAAVGNLILDLSRAPSHAGIRDAMARALGDPSLEIAFALRDGDSFVDADGNPLAMPTPSRTRSVTPIRNGPAIVALLVHDPALDEDPGLVEQAGTAARFAIDNARLQLELRSQLEEVRASRARIVQTGDAERRRVERDLHDGAQQRLATLAISLRMARDRAGASADPELERLLDAANDELGFALRDLRELARGIHPAILTEEGLGSAVDALAVRSPIPVEVRIPPDRFPTEVEATAYFVVCEALANVVKHAHASEAAVNAGLVDGRLRVEIVDDGAGGADATRGTGLRGLADRVAAVGGSLRFDSPTGAGTRVTAEIPCA